MINIRKLEAELWESADLLRQGSKLTNMAVHGLNGKIVSGDEANSFYHDAHNLAGKCDYVMANPPFNVDKVKAESASAAGRLPFGLPGVNAKTKEIEDKNYSLTPGAYVGVAEVADDGVDFHERMNEIHTALDQLNKEANVLMDEIQKVWEELK